jgi:hypothetical protein
MLQLLQNAIGGTTDQNTTNNTSQTGTQQQTGTQNTTTTGNTAGNTSQQTQSTADVSNLQKVFQQQQAGITPEMLSAIFAEGSKAAPSLVAATANAVGARSTNNDPLATALSNLSSQLTSKAAELDLQQKNASGQTAAEIARLTAGSTTTGTTNQTNSQGSVQTNDSTSNNTTNTNQTGQVQTDTSPDYGNAAKLIAMLAGGSALSGAGGLGSLFSGITGGGAGAGGNNNNGLMALLSQGGNGLLNLLGLGGNSDPALGGTVNNNPHLTPQQIEALANSQTPSADATGGTSGQIQGPTLEELLGGQAGLGSIESTTPVANNTNWWADEGWDQIDWGSLGVEG